MEGLTAALNSRVRLSWTHAQYAHTRQLRAQEKVTGFETGCFRGTRNRGLLFPLSLKEASNSVQHEQCCSNETTIHLAGELRPPPAATDDHDLRGPVTVCSTLRALFFDTQTQNRDNLLELTLVLNFNILLTVHLNIFIY